MIRMPLGRAQEPVGLLVADDLLVLAVPAELASQQVGEVSQDAEGGRAMGNLDVDVG